MFLLYSLYVFLMLILLKGVKEKVKEQEELPERPGQTECKVFIVTMFREVLFASFNLIR